MRRSLSALVLASMVAGKLGQEWILHGAQILDRYNLSEVVDRLLH